MYRKMFNSIVLCLMLANVESIPTQMSSESIDLVMIPSADLARMPSEELVTMPSEANITLSSVMASIQSILNSNYQNLNFDLYPTLHSAIIGPFNLIGRAFKDLLMFYDQRSMRDMLSMSTLKSTAMGASAQVMNYWSNLMAMELECIYRTICDLSGYFSPRLPYWINQLLGIYFTTHSTNNMYFRAMANGMINNNCINYYPKCSSTAFFNRFVSNVSDIVSTTISPLTYQVMNALNSSSILQ